MTRICKQCGKDFEVQVHNQLFCSTKCGQNFRDNKRRLQRPVFTKVCPQCGEQFTTTSGKKIFCSAKCANKSGHEERKSRRPVYKKICPQCGKEFETTSRRKKYCNMTCTGKFHHSYAKQPAFIVDWTELETPPELLVVRCYNCGHEFRQTFPNEKFCSDDCRLDFFKLNEVANFFGKFSYLYQLQLEA